ncbi:UNVERIFIED_CONTAM: E3 ubiquitin-protein ligase RING1 [Sesamum latifolium]|uniref:RING-type E3 ubiquitin transferase n=1 Tax=Sesamum latifolium TaxID=2727402 RepID=A0AAW2UXS8_9LAMI
MIFTSHPHVFLTLPFLQFVSFSSPKNIKKLNILSVSLTNNHVFAGIPGGEEAAPPRANTSAINASAMSPSRLHPPLRLSLFAPIVMAAFLKNPKLLPPQTLLTPSLIPSSPTTFLPPPLLVVFLLSSLLPLPPLPAAPSPSPPGAERGAQIFNLFLKLRAVGDGRRHGFRLPTNLGDYFIGPGLEQLIQQLAENDPNRYGTPPASKSAVEGLPNIKITEEMLPSDSSQCAVCKDSFELNEEAKQMPCKHIYHKDCILPWLELHNSCPVCRYELPTDDPDYENRRTGQMNDNSNRTSNISNIGLGLLPEVRRIEMITIIVRRRRGWWKGGLEYLYRGFLEGLVHQQRRAAVGEELREMMEGITAPTTVIVEHPVLALEQEEGRPERKTSTEGLNVVGI